MHRIITTFLLLTICFPTFGQIARTDTLYLSVSEKFTTNQNDKLKFPIIKTGNSTMDTAINTDLKNRFTNNEYPDLPTDSAIIKWAGEQLTYLNFQVTYLKNELISLNIRAEGCGAYCSGWTDYFTYNVTTGKYVPINEIVDTTGKFKKQVLSDKDKQYAIQETELKKLILDKSAELDEDTYQWALEEYETCKNGFTLKSFALHPDHLEIIETCNLPNAIKNLTPAIDLQYKYVEIKKYLKFKP